MMIKTRIKTANQDILIFDGTYLSNGFWIVNTKYFGTTQEKYNKLIQEKKPFCEISDDLNFRPKKMYAKKIIGRKPPKKNIAVKTELIAEFESLNAVYVTRNGHDHLFVDTRYSSIVDDLSFDLYFHQKEPALIVYNDKEFVSMLMSCRRKRISTELDALVQCVRKYWEQNKRLKL